MSAENGWMDRQPDGCRVTTDELGLKYIKTKSYPKFQLNMSKHVGEKCGILHISYIQVQKEG